ncbi:lamin tail domain-containing protein [Planctomycetota bacterium]
MYHPRAADNAEWIELYNQMGIDIDMSGWSLQGGIEYFFPEGTIISAGDYIVVASAPELLLNQAFLGVLVLGPFTGKLSNNGETIYLVNNSGRLLNELRYRDSGDWPVAPDGAGVSLAKLDPGRESDNPANWTWSEQVGGSPGSENFSSDEAPSRLFHFNEMASITDGVFYMELINIGEVALNLSGLSIEVQGSIEAIYACSDMILEAGNTFWLSEADLGFIPDEGDRIFLWSGDGHLLDAVRADNKLRGRYPDGTGQWLYPSVATLGQANIFEICQDIVINEIMYHPIEIPAMPVEIETVTLVPEDATCSVYVPEDDSLGTQWTGGDDSFSDLDWTDGIGSTSGVGYETDTGYEPYIGTDVSNEMYGVNASVYLRIHFDVADPNTFDGLLLSMRFDDGFIAYLNGTEVARYNAPENAAWDSLSTTDNSDSQAMVFQVFDISAYMYSLSPGHNILAVHGLNVSSTSSDLLIQPLLSGVEKTDQNQELPEAAESANWIELYNRGIEAVDLSDWSFTDGITYTFPQGTTMESGEYLVVSENASWQSSKFPDARIIGDFGGNLSNGGENLVLSDHNGNPVDKVRYYDGGAWPEYADGGGCSLELIEPFANNNRPEAWAASNELARSPWQEYAYRMEAERSPVGNDSLYSEFVMGLLDQGEILIDDIEVIEDPDGAAEHLLQNSDFSTDTDKWRILGNHSTSAVISDPEDAFNPVLLLVATGPTEHMSNHAETTLANGRRVNNGQVYEIRFRARWVAGTPLLNTRLLFNRVAYSTPLDVPESSGTPGTVNSRVESNIGPTFSSLMHAPAVPIPHQTVNITVRAEDPDGIVFLTLHYRNDEDSWHSAFMTTPDGSLYSGSIPGYGSGTTVQFYIEGWDNLTARSFYPAAGPESFAQYQVLGQSPRDTGVHNYRIVMRNDQKEKLYELTNLMSNEYLGTTLIVNESDVYYNVGVRLKSSEHGRPPNKQAGRIGFSLRFEAQNLFRGVHDKLAFDRSNGQQVGQQEMLLHTAMNRFGGPSKYHDLGYLMAPDPAHSSGVEVQIARFNKLFTEESYGTEGGSGTLYEYELVYPLTQTVGNDPEGLKYPQEAGGVQGKSVDSYLGQDKEDYRWHLLIKNNRDEDNYEPIMNMTYVLSRSGSEFFSAVEQALDVDEWMRSFAVGSTYGPSDNWITGSGHNALFYHRPTDDKILFFLHDLDYTRISASIKSNSILQRITTNPHWNHIFYGYVYDFLQTSFNREYMSYWADQYKSLLPEQSWSSWLNYIENRHNNVQQQLQQVLPPEIPFEISTVSAAIDRNSQGRVEGQGWINVNWILIVETGTILNATWDDMTHWYGYIDTEQVPGTYTLEAYDSQGIFLGTDTVQLVLSP